MKTYIIPGIIAKSQEELDKLLNKIEGDVKYVQLDIMDGKFVENESLNFLFELPETKPFLYEAHLMVDDPLDWIQKHGDEMDLIIAHIETIEEPEEFIDLIKNLGKKVGFALDPETPIEKVLEYVEKIDQVTIMTVVPGKYGAEFIHEMMDKVALLREQAPNLDIEVDGGMNNETIKEAKEAGANKFISGSFIMNALDFSKALDKLKKALE